MQFDQLKRREFIMLLGGAAAAWPVVARAQQPVIPVVGFLTSLGQNERPNLRDAFRRSFIPLIIPGPDLNVICLDLG